jgi:hypothetical protein
VSISTNPQFDDAVRSFGPKPQAQVLETNHERTLYVPYVFCNHLISRQQNELLPEGLLKGAQIGSRMMVQGAPAFAAGAKGERITSARAAARFANSELSWLATGVATAKPSARSSTVARR